MNLVQPGDQPIRLSLGEIRSRNAPRGHRQTTGTDGSGAGHVPFGIAHHHHIPSLHWRAQTLFGSLLGDGGDLSAVLVVVPKTPQRKLLPQPVGA